MNRLDLQRRHWIFTPGPALVVALILLIVLLAVCGLGSWSYVNYNLTSSPAAQLTDPWAPLRAPRVQGTFHTTDLVVDNTETVGGTLDVTGLIGTSAQPHFGANGIQINSFGGILISPFIRVWSGDPNTHVTGGKGSIVLDGATPAIWVNTDGASAWTSLATGGSIAGTPTHLAEFIAPGTIGDSPLIDNGSSALTLPASRILQIATTVTAGVELFSSGIIGAGGSAGSPSIIIHPTQLGATTVYAGFPTNNNNAEFVSTAGNLFSIGGTASPIGNDATTLPMTWDIAGGDTFIDSDTTPVGRLFINQVGALNASNAGIQHSSLVANRANYRANQWGANTGIPGVTGFKSRGAAVGTLASVNAGDVLWRATAIGVAGDNASIPLAGLFSINASFVGTNYVSTDAEIQLVPLAGPINGRKVAFLVDSEGVLHVKESANTMAGIATLDATGTAVVSNTRVTATTKFTLTAQEGPALTGALQQTARVANTSFTIHSSLGIADTGVKVYYQLWEPTIP